MHNWKKKNIMCIFRGKQADCQLLPKIGPWNLAIVSPHPNRERTSISAKEVLFHNQRVETGKALYGYITHLQVSIVMKNLCKVLTLRNCQNSHVT